MKRIMILAAMVIAFWSGCVAQDGLGIAPFFSQTYASNTDVTIVSLSGENAEKRGLTKYRSISVSRNDALADKIGKAVAKDGTRAVSKDVSFKNGRLYFGFYNLGKANGDNRYILYLDRRAVGKDKTTMIYIESRLDENSVRKMIK